MTSQSLIDAIMEDQAASEFTEVTSVKEKKVIKLTTKVAIIPVSAPMIFPPVMNLIQFHY